MVGLGETLPEVARGLRRPRRRSAASLVTVGQYLRPSPDHLPVARYYAPAEYPAIAELGPRARGSRTSRRGRWCAPRSRPTGWPRRRSRRLTRRGTRPAPGVSSPRPGPIPAHCNPARRPRMAVESRPRDGHSHEGLPHQEDLPPRGAGHRDRLLRRAGATTARSSETVSGPEAEHDALPVRPTTGRLHVCPECGCDLVYPVSWEERGRRPGPSSAAAPTASGTHTGEHSTRTRSSVRRRPERGHRGTAGHPAQLRPGQHGGRRRAADRRDPPRPDRADGLLAPGRAVASGARASWAEFAAAEPALAQRVRERLEAGAQDPATVRRDGAPRIWQRGRGSPRASSGSASCRASGADLRRDPRYALRTASADPPGWAGDATLSGRAEAVHDPERRAGGGRGRSRRRAEGRWHLFRAPRRGRVARRPGGEPIDGGTLGLRRRGAASYRGGSPS